MRFIKRDFSSAPVSQEKASQKQRMIKTKIYLSMLILFTLCRKAYPFEQNLEEINKITAGKQPYDLTSRIFSFKKAPYYSRPLYDSSTLRLRQLKKYSRICGLKELKKIERIEKLEKLKRLLPIYLNDYKANIKNCLVRKLRKKMAQSAGIIRLL